ncbi:MAG: GGDEF domain-containing protein [Lachnospiraceae bacterium]|nr:GGDEF domain-containing protein [Lachnospiraceae bacterium]
MMLTGNCIETVKMISDRKDNIMKGRRKRIGLFVAYPELTHVRRTIEGIMAQCEKYDYDLCVFASNVHFTFPHLNYLRGEANIFELANLDELDGVILDNVTMVGDKDSQIQKRLLDRLEKYPDLPKYALELPSEGVELVESNSDEVLREECRHVIEVHGRKKICVLTGTKGNEIAEKRLNVFLDEIRKHGLEVLPEHIIYGDFYYYSGDQLAKDIASGKVAKPDAVVCASDCMAMGLVDRLVKIGIKVPEDIVVVGFDASDEGAINVTTVASYEPAEKEMGAEAVNRIREKIEPGAEIIPFERDMHAHFHAGASCGCHVDPVYSMRRFRDYLYISSYNPADEDNEHATGIGAFMEGYVMEGFTAAATSEECIMNIYNYADLIKPYKNFYLCLKEDWKDMDSETYDGYPEKMLVYAANSQVGDESFYGQKDAKLFDTSRMLPKLDEDAEKASVYYFSPVHFDGILLGFAVLQRDFTQPVINVVFRSWIRYINNALEMTRTKERLEAFSIRDMMTGLYNRRGMYEKFRQMLASAKEGDSLFVAVADMDGLKYVNDTFGHAEGDYGIKAVSSTLSSVAKPGEICVRSGGDEFFLIGIGKYSQKEEAARAIEFSDALSKVSEEAGKEYNISASIGCVVFEDCRQISLDNALSEADERMYRYKVKNRRHRMV